MGIVPTFGKGVIGNKVAQFQGNLEKAMLFLLKSLGEDLVAYAKENRTYTDQTGNLTNSIGFAIVRGSKIVDYGGNNQPGDGADQALVMAMKMAANCAGAFSLIIVAGMNYAAYVEAKGYNVILPAELKCQHDFPAAMQKLQAKAMKSANEIFGNVI